MTPEMTFQCLLVSEDPAVFGTMDPILRDFSISTSLCPNPSSAGDLLEEGGTDLIVIDIESDGSSKLIDKICKTFMRHKPTILAIATTDCAAPGVHVVLRKPVTPESGTKSLRVAYSKMLHDYRKHTRFALMSPVIASDENERPLSVMVTNIGRGGVGLATKEKLEIGSIVSFAVQLPGLGNAIHVQARVLWTRRYGAVGCEFVHIPPGDLLILHAWLESRYRF
jgi:CheY-like chemotaxis protein/Tfp pilus assembly protein PilZ